MTAPFVLTTEAQARLALGARYGVRLLALFLQPTTASTAARLLGVPANRAAYHVARHAAAGLLVPAGRQERGVLYQAVAPELIVPPELARLAGDPERVAAGLMRDLGAAVLRSARSADPEGEPEALRLNLRQPVPPDEPRADPLLFRVTWTTMHLTPARERALWQELQAVVGRYAADTDGRTVTLAQVGFRGRLHDD